MKRWKLWKEEGLYSTFIFFLLTVNQDSRESYSQIRKVLYLSLFCVNQWEEDKYFILLRHWLKSILCDLPVFRGNV
jgi:hypothetical protein